MNLIILLLVIIIVVYFIKLRKNNLEYVKDSNALVTNIRMIGCGG